MAILYTNVLQVCNSEGPIAGAKLYFYAAGSTVPKKVFNDHTLESVATQPLVANANGIFPEYFAQLGAYRIQIFDANDNLIATRDWLTLAGGSGSDSFPVPDKSGYLHYDIDTDTFSWVTIEGDDHKVAVDGSDASPDYLSGKIKDSDTVKWIVEDGKMKASVEGEFDTYRVKINAGDDNPGFLTDKLEDSSTITWEVSGNKVKANVQMKPPVMESTPLSGTIRYNGLGNDIATPEAIGVYFFTREEIKISRICTSVPELASMAAADIQFAVYAPSLVELPNGDIPMVGSSGNRAMSKVATGSIKLANGNHVYSVGVLDTPLAIKGWFCVVLACSPSSSWPPIAAAMNYSEMMSMADPTEHIPLQFVRDDIVVPYAPIATMWPDTVNSIYGSDSHMINQNVIPYIRLEMQ